MNNVNKIITCMCAVIMVMGLHTSCVYSQDKPSEEVIKNIIANIELKPLFSRYTKDQVTNVKYDVFKITHSFIKKGSDNRDNFCVEVTYKLSFTLLGYHANGEPLNTNVIKEVEKYSFIKKGDDWYGGLGGW